MNDILAKRALDELINTAEILEVKEFCEPILGNPHFLVWSGSSRPEQHHYGRGGLVIHTNEVVSLCLQNNNFFSMCELVKLGYTIPPTALVSLPTEISNRELFLAALFHDVGKMQDYEPIDDSYQEWKSSEHKYLIHHISRSALTWYELCLNSTEPFITKEVVDNVLHAILAHHGFKEWGSPVIPKTRMAWMLHICDNLSAKMCEVK